MISGNLDRVTGPAAAAKSLHDFSKGLAPMRKFSKIKKDRNLYEDVLKEIKKAILSGTYPTGALLPSELNPRGKIQPNGPP